MSSAPPPTPENRAARDGLGWALFFAALMVYATTRLIEIEGFPIYFFCDEAMHTVQFRDLVANNWHAVEQPHELLPAYFLNGGMFNLSLSVYVQGIASLIGGQTVETVRATSAVASLGGAVALGLLLRQGFKLREWWSGVAFLTVIPCWFLHSRTGFETVLMVSSYSWFLYFYLSYRERDPGWIFAAMIAGAATFYAYSPGQGIMLVTGVGLLISDFSYHWKQRVRVGAALVLGLVMFVPYARFRIQHPTMLKAHLAELGSYWTQAIPLTTKLLTFAGNYVGGLSPRYWFMVGGDYPVRHLVPGHAHIPALLTPLALIGLVLCLVRWRSARHRLIVIVILASPFSSALVQPGITRMLSFVVAFALCAALGFDWLLEKLSTRPAYFSVRYVSFGLLTIAGFGLLQGALADGPLFTRNYGLYGMQWGSQAVYRDLIPRYLKSDPAANVIITHITSNSPDVFPRFFGWMDERRVTFASLDDICSGDTLPEAKDLVLLSAEEFETLPSRPEVERFVLRERVPWPDGRTGYYWGHLYLDPTFMARSRARPDHVIRPVADRLIFNHIPLAVTASGVASGRVKSLFAEGKGEVIGRPGQAMNIEIFFDGPVGLDRIRVEAGVQPETRITLWGSRAGKELIVAGGEAGQMIFEPSLGGQKLDYVRIELSGTAEKTNELSNIRLIPAATRR